MKNNHGKQAIVCAWGGVRKGFRVIGETSSRAQPAVHRQWRRQRCTRTPDLAPTRASPAPFVPVRKTNPKKTSVIWVGIVTAPRNTDNDVQGAFDSPRCKLL